VENPRNSMENHFVTNKWSSWLLCGRYNISIGGGEGLVGEKKGKVSIHI